MENKVAAFRHHITRMHSLPLTNNIKQKEWSLIQLIPQKKLHTNTSISTKHTDKVQIHQPNHNSEQQKNKTWMAFTYYSSIIKKITNLFKNTNVGIVFKNTNSLQHFTKPKIDDYTQEQKKLETISLHVTIVKCHTLGRLAAVYFRDIKNMLGT